MLFIAVNSPNLAHQHWEGKKTANCPKNFDWDCVQTGILGIGPLDGSSGGKLQDACKHTSYWFLPAKIKDFKKSKVIKQINFFFLHLIPFQGFKKAWYELDISNTNRAVPNARVIVQKFLFCTYFV